MKIVLYLVLGLVVLVLVLFTILGKKSRSGQALGVTNGRLAPCSGKPNCVSSEAGTSDKFRVEPYSGTSMAALKSAIEQAGGTVTNQTDNYLSAEFMSDLFKFVDDFEARQDGNKIHIRSASRVGYSDRGVNRKRVEALRERLQ